MKSILYRHRTTIIALLLAILMAATRFHHFGSSIHLPDASWAVFLLGGFYLGRVGLLGCYLAEASLIDYASITVGGVSDWCVTPAYLFLIPTYLSLWLGGVWYARRHRRQWTSLGPLAAALLAAVSVAFLISNASFYLLSGYFPDMSWLEFASRVARYFPRYAANTAVYVLLAAGVHVAAVYLSAVQSTDVRSHSKP